MHVSTGSNDWFLHVSASVWLATRRVRGQLNHGVRRCPQRLDPLSKSYVQIPGAPLLWGLKGDDEFYIQTRLANGCAVDSALLLSPPSGELFVSFWNTGLSVAVQRPGSDSPYIKVHWWMDAALAGGNSSSYIPKILIRCPRGLPYK